MSFTYVVHGEAQKEYEKVVKWYLKRSLNAAEGFVDAVDLALKQACLHPTRWRNTYKHYYELGLKKYPYILIFTIEIEQKTISVWKFYHNKRNPKRKFHRLKE